MLYYLALAGIIAFSLFILAKGQRLVDATEDTVDGLERRIKKREEANRRLSDEIADLQDPQRSRAVVERIARDELNMAGPDETVYEFQEPAGGWE